MAETQPKRLREEPLREDSSSEFDDSGATSKRHKPYNTILNLLEQEEDDGEPSHEPGHELSQDLSAIFTTLQQELSSSTSCDSTTTFDFDSLPSTAAVEEPDPSLHPTATEDDGVKSVMRHLLEASDDELGIPNRSDEIENNVEILNSVGNFPFGFTEHEGLWELEDEAANYYTVLQSELFM
ncbi:uncharacterized protein LOC105159948 [Sesamum indicum]|uniref:Uncharacterized protein LOC105159948 n=1 Tax=Sesamum indicum TaxID=4182 RepID=A0A6I9T0P2_SESIN|nr:uncharacterized protein LOC105159948 [Sesamum indicum]